jgi:hypothetical protein
MKKKTKAMDKEIVQGTCNIQYHKQGKRGKTRVREQQHLHGRR